MAAWRPTDRDRDPISDQRALASQLQIRCVKISAEFALPCPARITAWSLPMPMVALDC